jgi:hypothetical protein
MPPDWNLAMPSLKLYDAIELKLCNAIGLKLGMPSG